MTYQCCFLIYLARSGSTLLAYHLNQYKQIGVTIEENIPETISQGKKFLINTEKELEEYLDRLYHDKKFKNWNIQRNTLKAHLLEHSDFPIRYRDFIKSIHELYFYGKMPEVVIHKRGDYCLRVEKVRRELPEAKFIFINRDPRAIYNSQRQNKNSITGKPMNQSIIVFALIYKRLHRYLRDKKKNNYLHSLNYEDFINAPDNEIKRIFHFLGLENVDKEQSQDYYNNIPDQQKELHSNVPGGFLSSRKEGWKTELKPHKRRFLQKTLKRELIENGYILEPSMNIKPKLKGLYFIWLLQYFFLLNLMKLTNWNFFSLKTMRFKKIGL
jgi:hypothetical protein